MTSGTPSIHLIVLKTNKLQEQLTFYSSIGLDFSHHRHGSGPYHYATNGHPVIELYPLPKDVSVPDTTTRLGFTVDALDSLIQRLRETGAKVVSEPTHTQWGYNAVVQDFDGRKIELVQA